ncbi:zinc finger protein 761-like isoform X2 [Mizuhopecten yessoensis]|uniref:zinc finger protein 761-like isoform X2 n=1 Tax=Mizuhopecten yessoensis TaxID=6573 RepID=UPI000B45ABA9|nr:zinc finger protein 761-like isoform X2 [Mizuhopecten yessoensis]
MASPLNLSKRPKLGRPATMTAEVRLKKRIERDKNRGKSRIYIGNEIDRWNAVKLEYALTSYAEVATLLLDSYEKRSQAQGPFSIGKNRRKNIPAELDDYTFYCKSCGSDDIEIVVKDDVPPPQTSASSTNAVRVKKEFDDNTERIGEPLSDNKAAENTVHTTPRPISLVCNASITRGRGMINCENDVTIPYKKRRKRTFQRTVDETDETAVAAKPPTETDKSEKKRKPKLSAASASMENSDEKIDKSKSVDEKLEENKESDEEDSGRRRSTRLKGKDRISFMKMIELDISDEDLDNSEDDLDDEDDEDIDDIDEDDELELESENGETAKKKQRLIVCKEEIDPDFDPETDEEVVKEELNEEPSVEESVDDNVKPKGKRGRKKKGLGDEKNKESFWKVKGMSKLTLLEKEAKKKEIERKKERKSQLKELRTIHRSAVQKCQDVNVKLEDHEDKYELTMFTSKSQKDRNLDFEHKSYYRYTCKLCDGQFNATDKASMENHIKLHLQGQLTCVDCGVTFSKPLVLFHHRIENHIEKFYTCEFCAEQFYTQRSLKVHLAKKHDQKPFKCPKCLEYFSCRADKKKHVTVAHPELAAQCEKCGEFFFGQERLQCHVRGMKCKARSDTEGNKIPCEVCGKTVLRSGMKKHMDTIHLKIHSHKCEVCSFTTNSTQSIKHHRMRHTGIHPIKCQLCDFSCVQDYQLKSHMRTHTGEKPYKCDQCNYASAWNVQLKEHRKAHDSDTQSTCDICNITFKHDRGITLHMKKFHSNQGPVERQEKSGAYSEIPNSQIVHPIQKVDHRLGQKIIVIRSPQVDGVVAGPNSVSNKEHDNGYKQLGPKRKHSTQYVAMKQTEYKTDLAGVSEQPRYHSPVQTDYHSPEQVEFKSAEKAEYHSPEHVEYHLPKQTQLDSKEMGYGISHTEYVSTSDQPYSEVHVDYSPARSEYGSTQTEYIVHISCQPDYMPAEQVVSTTNDA